LAHYICLQGQARSTTKAVERILSQPPTQSFKVRFLKRKQEREGQERRRAIPPGAALLPFMAGGVATLRKDVGI